MSIHQKSSAVNRLDQIKAGVGEGDVQRKATIVAIADQSSSHGAGEAGIDWTSLNKKQIYWTIGISVGVIILFIMAVKAKWIKI